MRRDAYVSSVHLESDGAHRTGDHGRVGLHSVSFAQWLRGDRSAHAHTGVRARRHPSTDIAVDARLVDEEVAFGVLSAGSFERSHFHRQRQSPTSTGSELAAQRGGNLAEGSSKQQ